MKIIYKFSRSSIGQSYTLRAGITSNAAILIAAFQVPSSRSISQTIVDPTQLTELWFRNETTGEIYPYDVFDPAQQSAIELTNERLAHSEDLPPGPVEIYPSGEGDFVYIDVFTKDFIGTVEANVPVKIELVDKTVAYAEAGFPTEYSATVNSDVDGRARFKLAKASSIRPAMNGATHKGKIKNQTFYLRPADTSGKASKMLVSSSR